jgi:hypothetical protein
MFELLFSLLFEFDDKLLLLLPIEKDFGIFFASKTLHLFIYLIIMLLISLICSFVFIYYMLFCAAVYLVLLIFLFFKYCCAVK